MLTPLLRRGRVAAPAVLCVSLTAGFSVAAEAPVVARGGMVSSAHPLATEAGVAILEKGGNAFDAAVAVASALNVVEPQNSGVGGYGTILVHNAASGETWFLNASAHIPHAVDADVFRESSPGHRVARRGAKAVSTPGNVLAWEAMHERYGALEWPALFESSIKLAGGGFDVSPALARTISANFDAFTLHTKRFYGKGGRPLGAGERLVQHDLARTLRLIASRGASAVREGDVAERIDSAMRSAEGFLSVDDLRTAKAEWWAPIKIDYRGHEVYTASPPSTAYPSLVRLGLMGGFDLRGMGHNSAQYLHLFAEATKHAFWTRLRFAGDPEFAPPPLGKLLSRRYWDEWKEDFEPDRATRFVPPGAVTEAGENTTHFVVADRWGNVVSATQTLGQSFGSRIMPEGTGVFLNNSLAYCTFDPPGNPMDAHAGRRKLSGDCPTIVFRDGRPWLVIGTPGGHTIGQTVPQMVINAVDFGMNVRDAIAAPRVSFVEPNSLALEQSIPADVRAALEALGHEVRTRGALGNAHALVVEYAANGKPARFLGAADPRGGGEARGPSK